MALPQSLQEKLDKKLNPVERFTDLFRSGDDRQDLELELLYYIWVALTGGAPPGNGGPAVGMMVNVPLNVRQADIMRKVAALTTDEIPPVWMVDCRKALRMVLVVNNTFNQQVSVDVIGNGSDANDSAFVIDSFNIAAGSRGNYGISNEQWMPYMGCRITPAVAPTAGEINASMILMEQKEE